MKPGFGYGIALYADADKADELARQAYELGVDWAKLDVVWAEIEAERGLFDFAALDATIDALQKLGLKVMLNVFAAPAWSPSGLCGGGAQRAARRRRTALRSR